MTYTLSMSERGRVTIPIKIRQKLGLTKKVNFDIIDDKVYLTAAPTGQDDCILVNPSKKIKTVKKQSIQIERKNG